MLAHAEDRHDVGVVQLRGGAGLALEPAARLGVAEHLARQDFQGHMPAERDLLGLVDHAHAPSADLAKQAVITKLF